MNEAMKNDDGVMTMSGLQDYIAGELTPAVFSTVELYRKTITPKECNMQIAEHMKNCIGVIQDYKINEVANTLATCFGNEEASRIMTETKDQIQKCITDPSYAKESSKRSNYVWKTEDLFNVMVGSAIDVMTEATKLGYFKVAEEESGDTEEIGSNLSDRTVGEKMRDSVGEFIKNVSNRTTELLHECWTMFNLFPDEETKKLVDLIGFEE